MINEIRATCFKGFSFKQNLGQNTLFVGPNGSGKSARSQALILALTGYIPGTGKKTNADILENYGSSDTLVVGIKIGETILERGFVRKGDKVSQGFKVNGKAAKEAEFSKALGIAGAPLAVDISAFMALSDAKKIDAIFDLYPPESDINKIVADIDAAKENINNWTATKDKKEGALQQLTTARATMQLPMGTLADTVARINDTEEKLNRARNDLKQAEIDAAKEKAVNEERERMNSIPTLMNSYGEGDAKTETKVQSAAPDQQVSSPTPASTAAISIQTIIDTLNRSGCSICAARLVAVRELKKYSEVTL